MVSPSASPVHRLPLQPLTAVAVLKMVNRPELVNELSVEFGVQAVVVAIDARRATDGSDRYEVFTRGGRTPTGIDAIEWAIEMEARGAGEILLTSMDRDGTRDGFELTLTRAIVDATSIPVYRLDLTF